MEPAQYIIKRFVEELWNGRRLDVADQIFSEDCVTHQLRSGVLGEPAHRGPQEMKEHVSGWLKSFPDLRFNIEQMITERDRVVSQLVIEGTHQGTLDGNFADRQKNTNSPDHDTPHRKRQDCGGLGISGTARVLCTARRAP